MKERMTEPIERNNLSPEEEQSLTLGRAISNVEDAIYAVNGKNRTDLEGRVENFRGALAWVESQKSKAARIIVANTLVFQLATACSPRTISAEDIISTSAAITEQYIPPTEPENAVATAITIPTITPTTEPTAIPTAIPTEKPTEVPTPVRPGSGGMYSEAIWSAIESGYFEKQEKGWQTILNYYGNAKESDRPFFAQELGSTKANLVYKYFVDLKHPNDPSKVIVGLESGAIPGQESGSYKNAVAFPPIDFTKSKGLDVYFMESLPYEKDGHSIPTYLMPTFVTIDANEESVASGKMQERFINTTLANIDGELVRINSEGKVVAKIGVKPETQEAKWVRPLCTDYSNPENYTPITIEEIQDGTILYDENVQAKPFSESVVFPDSYKFEEGRIGDAVIALDKEGKRYLDYFESAFFYKIENVVLNTSVGEQRPYVMTQQYYQKDNTPGFIKVLYTARISDPTNLIKYFAGSDQVVLPQYSIKNIHRDEAVISYRGNIFKSQESKSDVIKRYWIEYFTTGQIPKELSKIIFLTSSVTQK